MHVTRIEFRPDGRALLAGSTEHSLTRLWDTTRGQAIGEPMIDEAAGGFRPDGRAFLTLGKDGTVKLRDATTGDGSRQAPDLLLAGHLCGVPR